MPTSFDITKFLKEWHNNQPPPQPKHAKVTIGTNIQTGHAITIGDVERRSGLYVLGISGMGKSTLLVNLMVHDIENGHGLFFLDPHGDAISDVVDHSPYERIRNDALLLDPTNKECSFGINLLSCKDVNDLTKRQDTYTRAKTIFEKIWEGDWEEKPWLQLVLQNTLYAFIDNPEFTLAEVPAFLQASNTEFRNYIARNIKHYPDVAAFWLHELTARRERDQQERMDAALTRVSTLLGHPYVRHIVGQHKTTIDFADIMEKRRILMVTLSAKLPADIKKFIGTILISEFAHAAMDRAERHQFCVFVDEFQNFTYSDDFNTLFTQARKYGIATTIAHQERYGQLGKNQKIIGATAAAANKVLFQTTERDAQELAPGFASLPPQETKQEPALAISSRPFWDLVERGHGNPFIQECINQFFMPIARTIEFCKTQLDMHKVARQGFQDEACSCYRSISL